MNAQEIVNILKENKIKGIAFYFFSGDIQDWIHDNFNNPNLLYFDSMGNWQYFKDADFDDYDNVVFALSDMFDLPPKPQSGWVEIDIEDDGKFRIDDKEERSAPVRETYNWFNWQDFLKDSRFYRRDFTAFGGWQYEDCNTWFTSPRLAVKSPNATIYQDLYNVDNFAECDCKPAIPVKIRFWREMK